VAGSSSRLTLFKSEISRAAIWLSVVRVKYANLPSLVMSELQSVSDLCFQACRQICLLYSNNIFGTRSEVIEQLCYALLSIRIISERVDDPDLTEGNRCSQCRRFVVSGNEFDVLDVAALRYCLLVKVLFWVCAILTFGIVMVLMIVREARLHNRSVLSCTMPRDGFRIVTGITKSDVRMMFFSQSTVSPWGLKFSPKMLALPAISSGHSLMILKLSSVSTSRPGEVPTAEPMYVMKNPLEDVSLVNKDCHTVY
jgi:hypothetical protein